MKYFDVLYSCFYLLERVGTQAASFMTMSIALSLQVMGLTGLLLHTLKYFNLFTVTDNNEKILILMTLTIVLSGFLIAFLYGHYIKKANYLQITAAIGAYSSKKRRLMRFCAVLMLIFSAFFMILVMTLPAFIRDLR